MCIRDSPLTENFPEFIEVDRLEIDTANIDFIAIKVGDVIGTANTENARFIPKSMGFEIEEQHFKAGEKVSIPFYFESAQAALGFQLELAFDTNKLAFSGTGKENYLSISENNLGTNRLAEGQLKIVWINQTQLPIRAFREGLFQLEFIALADGQISSAIHLTEEEFPAQFYSNQITKVGLQSIDSVSYTHLTLPTTPYV